MSEAAESAPIAVIEVPSSTATSSPTTSSEASSDGLATEATPVAAERVRTDAAARKEWIRLQVQDRKLAARERALGTKAAAVAKFEAARNDPDPRALLRAAGIDERAHYRAHTEYALRELTDAPPVDPVRVLEERIATYERERNEERAARQQETTSRQVEDSIRGTVLPAVADAKAFQVLHKLHKGDQRAVAGYVFEAMKSHYDRTLKETGTGEVIEPAEAAKQLEEYHSGVIEAGLKEALGLERFGSRYRAAPPEAPAPAAPSRTLTNRSNPGVSRVVAQDSKPRKPPQNPRMAEIMRKRGLVR